MTNVVMPFLMSMLLGRTIDLTSYTIGGNIYDDADYNETPVKELNSTYHVIQQNAFPYSYFGMPIDIVLRIKSNLLSSSSGTLGLDGLLKDTSWKYNSVIVSVTTVYKTLNRTMSSDSSLISDWRSRIPDSQTHFAHSLAYGGWSVVLFRFRCDIPGDVEAVRRTLTRVAGATGTFGPQTKEIWDKAIEAIESNADVRGKVIVETHVYSTVPPKIEIDSFESLLEAVSTFPGEVGAVGEPLFMVLRPLNQLDENFPAVIENTDLVGDLEKLDEMFDDVKITKSSLMRWLSETLAVFSDEEEEKISKMLNLVNDCIRAFYKVGTEASLFKTMNGEVLEAAFHMYLGGIERGSANYNMAYRRLKEDIDAECGSEFLPKIRGLLKVYDNEHVDRGKVDGGLAECQQICLDDGRCRAVGYADHLTTLDVSLGLYLKKEKQCWIYFRSSSTAIVNTPNGYSGDMGVYDRRCF